MSHRPPASTFSLPFAVMGLSPLWRNRSRRWSVLTDDGGGDMHVVRLEAVRVRRLPLVSLLVGLCLIALSGPAASARVVSSPGDTLSAAVSHLAVVVRPLPDRLAATHGSALKRS